MYSYQNTENSQNKHHILNRIVKSIEKQVKYSDVDDYFWKPGQSVSAFCLALLRKQCLYSVNKRCFLGSRLKKWWPLLWDFCVFVRFSLYKRLNRCYNFLMRLGGSFLQKRFCNVQGRQVMVCAENDQRYQTDAQALKSQTCSIHKHSAVHYVHSVHRAADLLLLHAHGRHGFGLQAV